MTFVRWLATVLCAALIFLILWWPTAQFGEQTSARLVIAGSFGLALLLVTMALMIRGGLAIFIVMPLMVMALLIRFLHYGLVQFHGDGFSDQFFFHANLESARIAWYEYSGLIVNFSLLMLVILLLLWLLAQRGAKLRLWSGIGLLAIAIVTIVIARQGMPEWDLVSKGWRYYHPLSPVVVTDEMIHRWHATGLINTDLVPKSEIVVEAAEQPKNLILLYLEGLGISLIEHPDWPDLAPNLRSLLDDYSLVDNFYASAYITMEGITNSQCGTLFPFYRWMHDSLAGGDGLAENMACMGDALAAAGYYQVYLGGASIDFTGKGDFLSTHGYDEALGWEHWKAQSLKMRTDPWGLGDSDLFEQSLEKIEELRLSSKPWNLTMLTLGTHIPGYFYPECERYDSGKHIEGAENGKFLDAIHCTDYLLGVWLDALESAGVFEDTVVVITADHQVMPNSEILELFGDAVADERIPFIVLGRDLPTSAISYGAGYDLAPTILDMLDIQHNIHFILGRSLAKRSPGRKYFFGISNDFYEAEYIENHPDLCDTDQDIDTIEIPITGCEKKEMFAVLGATVDQYSKKPEFRLSCDHPGRLVIRNIGSKETESSMTIYINDIDISDHFSAYGNIIGANLPGLYAVLFSEDGAVVARHHLDPNEPEKLYAERLRRLFRAGNNDAHTLLMIWQPGLRIQGALRLPAIGNVDVERPAVWFIDLKQNKVLDRRVGESGEVMNYALGANLCRDGFRIGQSGNSLRSP